MGSGSTITILWQYSPRPRERVGKKVKFGIPLNKQQQEHNSDGTIVSSTDFTSKSEACSPFDDWTSGSSSMVIWVVEFSREV